MDNYEETARRVGDTALQELGLLFLAADPVHHCLKKITSYFGWWESSAVK